jgi:hypothetical protein
VGLVSILAAGAWVFWGFDALPFQDLPAHAGLIALRHRFEGSPFDQRFYVYAPHLGPYSLFRFLGERLVGPLGAVRAVRALAALSFVATPLALVWARRRLHGDASNAAGYFGVALGLGFMTLLGFASYLLGVALLIVALTVWLELMARLDRESTTWIAEGTLALLSLLLLFAHGYAFAVFVVLALTTAAATGRRGRRMARLRGLLPAIALAVWIAWRERVSALPAGSVPAQSRFDVHFQGPIDKLSLLVTPTLLTRTGLDVMVGLVVWLVIGAAAVRSVRWAASPSAAPEELASRMHVNALAAGIAALAAGFLVLPHSVGWFGFVDGRLVPLAILLGLMAMYPPALGPRLRRAVGRLGPAAACAMVAIALYASRSFQREAEGWHDVLAAVPDQARLLNLPLDPNSDVFTAHPFVHYDKLALVGRPVLVSDVWLHQGSALYPTRDNPVLRLPATYVESDLRVVDWPAYHLADWDFVLVRTRPGAPCPGLPPSLTLASHAGGWWLFRVTPFRFAPTQT